MFWMRSILYGKTILFKFSDNYRTSFGVYIYGIFIVDRSKANKKYMCVQVSRPYLGFCPDPKHFIVNCERNVVKCAGKWGKMY